MILEGNGGQVQMKEVQANGCVLKASLDIFFMSKCWYGSDFIAEMTDISETSETHGAEF